MTEEQWATVENLFNALWNLPPHEREARLKTIADPGVRSEVASLLENAGPTDTLHELIGGIAVHAAGGQIVGEGVSIPQRFGVWRVTGFIGRGGMGAVFKAVRDDGTFEKLVAIKVLNMATDTPAARERFRQERQILAGLEHPNIAHLLDGGETDTGESYIVLEFIDGENIIDHCNRRNLSRDDRLRLFLQVCAAVQFAHQNLVIHRDLKPANIMVTRDGMPKLLDFGIAKLMDPTADRTATNLIALTPSYASPEQVRGGPITTASDVYSLGIVLYLLLSGRMPYQIETLSPLEIDHAVCETPPAPPNVSADLDNIILMALRKEPARRYGSAQQLADDIERAMEYLPVRARADTFRYRAGKYIRRNRVPVAASAFVALSLAVGLGVAAYQARLAQQRFQQVRKLANTFLFQFHDAIADIPGTTKARALVVKTALEYLDSLSKSAGNDVGLLAELAQAYDRVAEVQGAARGASLGDSAAALSSYQRALALYERLAGRDVKYAKDAADCLRRIAVLQLSQQRFAEATASVERGFVWGERIRSVHPESAASVLALLYQTAAELEDAHGSPEKSIEDGRKSVQYVEETVKALPASDAAKGFAQLSAAHSHLGWSLLSVGDLQGAEPFLNAALADTSHWVQLEPRSARAQRNKTAALLNLVELYGSESLPSLEDYARSVGYARAAEECIGPQVDADPSAVYPKVYRISALARLAWGSEKLQPGSGRDEARRTVALWHDLSVPGRTTAGNMFDVLNSLRRILPAVRASEGSAESSKLARQLVRERQAILAGHSATDDMFWLLVLDQAAASHEASAAGHREESRRLLAEGLSISQPLMASTATSLAAAFGAAVLYKEIAGERAASGNCAEADEWQRKELALWQPLSAKNPYAAMRVRRASASASTCK